MSAETKTSEENQSTSKTEPEIVQEKNKFIFKYQKENINEKLGNILGEKFRKYRDDFNKTQDYEITGFLPDVPLTIAIEFINRCNLKCIMCYTKHHTEEKATLSLDDIDRIMKECKDNETPSVIVGLGSEMTLYKDIKEALDLIRKNEIIDVFFGSNGVLMTEEIIKSIMKNKISRVEISLDAATPETYKKIRSFDQLTRIEANIEKLIEYKKRYNSPLPVIRLCFVLQEKNKHEAQMFIDKWKDKVDYIDFQRCVDMSNMDEVNTKINYEELKDAFCSQPFYSLSVWSNGNVSPCCTYYGKKLILGNVRETSLKELWHGEKINRIRQQLIAKKFNPVCAKCLYFRDKENIEKTLLTPASVPTTN